MIVIIQTEARAQLSSTKAIDQGLRLSFDHVHTLIDVASANTKQLRYAIEKRTSNIVCYYSKPEF